MIYVIPVGRNRPHTLPYAVRSLERYGNLTQLVTVGETPTVTPDLHIPSPNTADPHTNTSGHLRAVCDLMAAERITEWVWTHDDIVLLAPWTPTSHARAYPIAQHVVDFPAVPTYSQGLRRVVQWMKRQGHDPQQVPCGPIHRPRLIDTAHLAGIIDVHDGIGVPASLYEAAYVIGRPVTVTGDPKVTGHTAPHQPDCVSVVRSSWQNTAGNMIRDRFPDPSTRENPTRRPRMPLERSKPGALVSG